VLETIKRKMDSREDAIELLKADHRELEGLFRMVEAAEDRAKGPIARNICDALTIHARIEEKLFYPAIREKIADTQDLIDEAVVEHATLKSLIRQIERMRPGEELFDARLKVLEEYVQHHVREEEREILPLAEGKLDLVELGRRMARMKLRLSRGREEALSPHNRARSTAPRHRPAAGARASP